MSKVLLRPKKGLKVPFPMSQRFLSEDGEMVKKTSYWIRRIKEGDVEEVKKQSKPKASTKKKEIKTTKTEVES